MLIKGKDVIGLKIISVEEGKHIGEVEDIIFDPKSNEVKALLADKGGLFSDAKVILLEDTKSIGRDAVIVDSDKFLKKASEVEKPISNIAKENQYLTKTKVITEEGTDLGSISDLYFDAQTGDVDYFEVSQGTFQNIKSGTKKVKISDIVTVGEDAIVVRGYVEEQFQKQATERGIQGSFNKGKQNVQEQSQQTLDKAGRQTGIFTKYAEDRVEEFRKSPKTRETLDQLRHKTIRLQKDAESMYGDLKSRFDEVRRKPENRRRLEELRQNFEKAWEDLGRDLINLDRRVREEFNDPKNKQEAESAIDDTKQKVSDVGEKAKQKIEEVKEESARKATSVKRKADKSEGNFRKNVEDESRQAQTAGTAGGESEIILPKGTTVIPPSSDNKSGKEYITTEKSKLRKAK